MVAQDRPAAFQVKAKKDVTQAACLVDALAELRPADLEAAVSTVKQKGKRWRAGLTRGLDLLAKHDPRIRALLPRSEK